MFTSAFTTNTLAVASQFWRRGAICLLANGATHFFPMQLAQTLRLCSTATTATGDVATNTSATPLKRDKLFKQIELEVRGHDQFVLKSYILFVKNTCKLLEIDLSKATFGFPKQRKLYERWLQWANSSKFAQKKYKTQYETRTYRMNITAYYLTGSTASTFLEYIERNLPEGVAMKVTYTELCFLPESITATTNDE